MLPKQAGMPVIMRGYFVHNVGFLQHFGNQTVVPLQPSLFCWGVMNQDFDPHVTQFTTCTCTGGFHLLLQLVKSNKVVQNTPHHSLYRFLLVSLTAGSKVVFSSKIPALAATADNNTPETTLMKAWPFKSHQRSKLAASLLEALQLPVTRLACIIDNAQLGLKRAFTVTRITQRRTCARHPHHTTR
jgi:hypothetical protein